METQYTAFQGDMIFTRGALEEVLKKVRKAKAPGEVLIFSDETGKTMDFDFSGTEKEMLKRVEAFLSREPSTSSSRATTSTSASSATHGAGPGPGRPKLGVVSREISLLPRHWEWLSLQTGGSSATIRRLIDEARKQTSEQMTKKQVMERTYKFISVMAGDREGYEEALRALYKSDEKKFKSEIKTWPAEIKHHAVELAKVAF